MNVALWFSFTRELIGQREELRERVRELEAERRLFIDALARAANKSPVFNRPEPERQSEVPIMAFGPTAVRARREIQKQEQETEILARAEQARTLNNGNNIPEVALPNE